ncbi:MAG: magnesium/cobalt transporter CorA [Acidimicrobiales bacterium]
MQGTVTSGGTAGEASRASIEQRLAGGEFFWLDLDGVDDEARNVMLDVLEIHHLAVDSAREFGQRPKAQDYDDFVYLVVDGAGAGGQAVTEVHFVVAEHFVVTIHRGPCAVLDEVRGRIGHHRPSELESPQIAILYLVIDQLVDSFFPFLDSFDNRIDELEDAILVRPTDEQLGTLFAMKRTLIAVRKVITPQRDMFASLTSGVIELPGVGEQGQRYLRDLYDHVIRISDLVDGYRDLLSSVMDTHLSTVSNRLNVVMKQLTIIATVFLPLSFLTGFFGQNFSWLVGRITGLWSFLVFGLGLELAAAAALLYWFFRRGWLGGPSS